MKELIFLALLFVVGSVAFRIGHGVSRDTDEF
jgi:hypothetical protein